MIPPDGTDLRTLADAAVRAPWATPLMLVTLKLFGGGPMCVPLSHEQREELQRDRLVLVDLFCANVEERRAAHTHRLAVIL